MVVQQDNAAALHPYYSFLPSYITKQSIVEERDEFITRARESLSALQQLRDGLDSVKLHKRHFRNIETLFKLKHTLPKDLHKELIEVLVLHLWEQDAVHIVDVAVEALAVEVLRTLLRKWWTKLPHAEAETLVIDWRLAHRAIERVGFTSPGKPRLASIPRLQMLASSMVTCVEKARPLFTSASGKKSIVEELWTTFSPAIKQVESSQCFKALGYFTMLFKVRYGGKLDDRECEWMAIQALLPEWLTSWASLSGCPDWDGHWFKVFSRVAKRFPAELGTNLLDAFPFVFAKVNDSFNLPSDLGSPFKNNTWPSAFSILQGTKRADLYAMRLCAFLLGNLHDDGTLHTANQFVIDILTNVKPFFHPSNASQAANSVGISAYYLSSMIAKRLGAEKKSGEVLKIASCRGVFDVLLEISFYGIYSKQPSVSSKSMYLLKSVICVDPSHCSKRVLDEMVKALDPSALSQTHMAPAAISSMSTFLYHLMCGQHPQGAGLVFSTYLAPVLRLTLPGIDPNDDKKTMSTVTLYFHLLSWLPLVNDVAKSGDSIATTKDPESKALFDGMHASLFADIVSNGSEVDRKIWELGSFLEEWSLALLDRCLDVIRSRANAQAHNESSKNSDGHGHSQRRGSDDRVVLEILNMMSLLFAQMSPAIYTQALRKTGTFVSNSFFTSAFGGTVVSTLVFDALQGDAALGIPHFMQLVTDNLLSSKSSSLMANEKIWNLRILGGITRFNDGQHRTLLAHREQIRSILSKYLDPEEDKEVFEAAASVLEELLHGLVGVYPLEFRSLPPREWDIATSDSHGMGQFLGAAVSWGKLRPQWHEPNGGELEFAYELLQDHLLGAFKAMDVLRSAGDVAVRQWNPLLKKVYAAVRGARYILVDTPSGQAALQLGSLPLLQQVCEKNPELLASLITLKSTILSETHKSVLHWRTHGVDGVTTIQVWKALLKIIKQLLVWRGSHLHGHQSKAKQNVYIKATTTDVASQQLKKSRQFEIDPLDVVPLSSRNEMIERVLFFYSKRKVQEHFESAHHVLSSSGQIREQYEVLLLDVEQLMRHSYEEVRKSAVGVMAETNDIYARWIYTRISNGLDVLEGQVVDEKGHVKEEVAFGALDFFGWNVVQGHLWKSRGSELERLLMALLRSNELLLKKIENEASKMKIGMKLQALFLAVMMRWRYVRGLKSVSFVAELLKEEPSAAEHWKSLLMYLVAFYPWLQPQESPLPIELWHLVIKHLNHDVLPVRQVSLLILIQLVKLHKTRDTTSSSRDPSVDSLLFAESTLGALIDCFMNNHRNTHRFSASADGQHANTAPSVWSFGVSEVVRFLSSTSSANPKPPPLSSIRLFNQTSDSFKSLELSHLKLVTQLCQMNPTAVLNDTVLKKLDLLTESIGSKATDEDRKASLSTLAEWTGGMLRGLIKLPASAESTVLLGTSSVLTLLNKVMSQINSTLIEPWSKMLYFVARPSIHRPQALEIRRLEPIVKYVLQEVKQSFAPGTSDDYTNQAKWLTVLEPILVSLLGGVESSDLSEMRRAIRSDVIQVIEAHGLTHRYTMVREVVAKALFILDASSTAASSDVSVLIEKLTASTGLVSSDDKEETPEELAAKETSMMWLARADHHGDVTDVARVMKSLLPIAFLTQNHTKAEMAVLAKNSVNAIALSLRLFSIPGDAAGAGRLEALLEILEVLGKHRFWKTRAAVLRFLTPFSFYHWTFLSTATQQRVMQLVMSFLADEQREVQDVAKYTLRSLVHVQRSAVVDELSRELSEQGRDARTKHPKFARRLQLQQKEGASEEDIAKSKARIKSNEAKMATSVLAMSAIVLAFPYSVPAWVPPLFEELGRFLYVKHATPTVSYLEKTVKDTLLEFKRTHQDNWLEIKSSLTQEQREVFEDVLISPSYYT